LVLPAYTAQEAQALIRGGTMVLVSYSGKEINAKIVFYGPGLCGKTTNLEYIYGSIPSNNRGKMVSMKTKTERTLFFDFLPLSLGELAGFKTRFLLYTVPGQVYYNATRKLVLKGVDAVVFVADSQRGKMEENLESLQNLRDNLKEHSLSLDDIPYVLQWNKRDMSDLYSVEELERAMNKDGVPSFEAVATTGVGVFETFRAVSKLLLGKLSKEIGASVSSDAAATGKKVPPATAAAPKAPSQAVPPPPQKKSREHPAKPVAASPAQVNPPAERSAPPADRPVAEEPVASAPAEPGARPSLPESDARGSQKSKGLWRWLRRDGEQPEEAPAASEVPAAQVAPPAPQAEAPAQEPPSNITPFPTERAAGAVTGQGPSEPELRQAKVTASGLSTPEVTLESGQGQEIVIPVVLPSTALQGKVTIRLELKVSQEVDTPDEESGESTERGAA